jgi:hypothetical protein
LLEEIKQTNQELEKMDGARRHFSYDWQEVGKYNPDYLKFVQTERERLGENHPLFRTQYALLPISSGGAFLSRQQIALMQGEHQRLSQPENRRTYIAGIDLAGEHEQEMSLRGVLATKQSHWIATPSARNDGERGQDSTVITIAEVASPSASSLATGEGWSQVRVVEHYQWTGIPHSQLYPQIIDILKKWNCGRIVVDATGMGQPIASFLRAQLGSKVIPFTFTQKSKSDMGFDFLSLVNCGRLKLYKQDGSPEYQELMFELQKAKAQYRPNQTINFYVDPQEGHDDFLISLALVAQAGKDFSPREAKGLIKTS